MEGGVQITDPQLKRETSKTSARGDTHHSCPYAPMTARSGTAFSTQLRDGGSREGGRGWPPEARSPGDGHVRASSGGLLRSLASRPK